MGPRSLCCFVGQFVCWHTVDIKTHTVHTIHGHTVHYIVCWYTVDIKTHTVHIIHGHTVHTIQYASDTHIAALLTPVPIDTLLTLTGVRMTLKDACMTLKDALLTLTRHTVDTERHTAHTRGNDVVRFTEFYVQFCLFLFLMIMYSTVSS